MKKKQSIMSNAILVNVLNGSRVAGQNVQQVVGMVISADK